MTFSSSKSRDANLRRSKIWRLSLFHYPQKFSEACPPPPPFTSPPSTNMEITKYIIWSLTWGVYYQNSWSSFWPGCFDARNNHCQWLNRCKNAPETVQRVRKFNFWAKNGLNLKLRHRKAQKMILSGRYGDPYGRPGDSCHIRES